jgi:hypothetical protein
MHKNNLGIYSPAYHLCLSNTQHKRAFLEYSVLHGFDIHLLTDHLRHYHISFSLYTLHYTLHIGLSRNRFLLEMDAKSRLSFQLFEGNDLM